MELSCGLRTIAAVNAIFVDFGTTILAAKLMPTLTISLQTTLGIWLEQNGANLYVRRMTIATLSVTNVFRMIILETTTPPIVNASNMILTTQPGRIPGIMRRRPTYGMGQKLDAHHLSQLWHLLEQSKRAK